MKIIVLGASGKIGSELVRLLAPNQEIVPAGRDGDVQVDYTKAQSVRKMFEQVGGFDALATVVGGDSIFKVYEELTDEDFVYGFQRKFLAQINLVRPRTPYARDGASFTLSSGFLSDYPNPASAATGPLEQKAREGKTSPASNPSDPHQNDEVSSMPEKRDSLS